VKRHWNYRLIKHTDGCFAIHECFYDDVGNVDMYSSKPCGFVSDTVEEMVDVLAMAKEALSKPVLNIEDLPGYEQ
jgi:hypothetical protein